MLTQPWYKKSRIQDFGYLICTDFSGNILAIGTNISAILPQQFHFYLGRPFHSIIKSIFEPWEDIIQEAIDTIKEVKYIRKVIEVDINSQKFYLSIYTSEKVIYFELEKVYDKASTLLDINSLSHDLSHSPEDIWQNLVCKIRNLLNLNKTVIFKFNNEKSGSICAESVQDGFKRSLDLHFSEDFITPEIVDYYRKSPISYCYDVDKPAIDFYTLFSKTVDYKHSTLATFPHTHLTYLKSVGAKTALIIPIIINDRCWGLLVGTHFENKWIDLSLRQVSNLMVQHASNLYGSSLKYNLIKFHKKIKEFELDLKGKLLVNDDINCTLSNNMESLCHVTAADGVAIVHQDEVNFYGECPEESQLQQTLTFIKGKKDKRVFKDHNFSLKHGSKITGKLPFAGIMCLRLNKSSNHHIIWFRKEIPREIIHIDINAGPFTLAKNNIQPSGGYKIWNNAILKSAKLWSANDLYAANRIYNLVQEIKIIKSEEQERINDELISLNNELEMLTFTLSHDIKNPLSIVKLGSQMLQLHVNKSTEELLKWSTTIQEASQSIENLVNSTLAFTQAKSYVFQKKEIPMLPILRKVVNEMRLIHEKNSCEIIWGEVLPLYGEKNLLYQVFLNLIGNAIKYSSNQENPKIEITSFLEKDSVYYQIKDNGIGIPESDLLSIFELFKRSDNTAKFKGSGVGLALVKRILDRLEATIDIQSIENKGTSISIRFPSR